MMRFAIVEKIHIIIYQINTEMPFVLMRINGTVEMLSPHKTTILRTGKYPTKIIITHIQKIIVTFQRIIIASYHIIHQITDIIDKIIIHLIYILYCRGVSFQFICHRSVRKRVFCLIFADTHGPPLRE